MAEAVERLLADEPLPGVSVATSTRAGLELIDLLSGAARAVIVDCLARPNPAPGPFCRLTLDDVAGSARLVWAHDVTVATAFKFARAAGVPMPDTVDIYAIEAADIDRIEEGLSPAVASAVNEVARRDSLPPRRPLAPPVRRGVTYPLRTFRTPRQTSSTGPERDDWSKCSASCSTREDVDDDAEGAVRKHRRRARRASPV